MVASFLLPRRISYCRCLSSPHKPKARHFDRSCSQFYREQRSGEIRFSTSTVLQSPSAFAFALVVVLGTKRSALTFTKNTRKKWGLQRVLKSPFCLRARLQPCRRYFARNAASAAEVRSLLREALLQHPLQPRAFSSHLNTYSTVTVTRTLVVTTFAVVPDPEVPITRIV